MAEADLQIKLLVFVCETLCAGLGDFSKRNTGGGVGAGCIFLTLLGGNPIFYSVLNFVFLLAFPLALNFY